MYGQWFADENTPLSLEYTLWDSAYDTGSFRVSRTVESPRCNNPCSAHAWDQVLELLRRPTREQQKVT